MIFIINEEHQTLHISYNQLSCTTDIPFFFISKGIFLCLDVDILLYFILFYLFIFCLETFEGIYPWKKIFLLCQYSKSYGYFKCVISGGLIKSFFGRKKINCHVCLSISVPYLADVEHSTELHRGRAGNSWAREGVMIWYKPVFTECNTLLI